MNLASDPRDWSDEEIVRFLQLRWSCDDFVFDCEVDTVPLNTKTPDFFKGVVKNVSLNGSLICYPNSKRSIYYNIPKTTTAKYYRGKCKLRFELESREKREKAGNMFMMRPIARSFAELNPERARVINQKKAESGKSEHTDKEKQLFELWGVSDCAFIGYYHYDAERELSIVDDIRKPNFARIPYYPNDQVFKRPISLHYKGEISGIEPNDYYLFNWKLSENNPSNPFEIYIDFQFQPQPIRPKWFIEQLFSDRYNDKSKDFESSANFLDTLSKQLSAKESTFIYELLQNANDYPVEGVPVDVEFHITDRYLLFMHSGDYFNVRNISGICGINEKEKTANIKTIGYKGIGFKTVFLNNHYVLINTGDYSFRFEDQSHLPINQRVIKRLEAPWPILPVWTEESEVDSEIKSVFNNADKKFRVKIALKPDNPAILHAGRKNYEALFKDVFDDSNLILFIPNIRSVKVFIKGELVRDCIIDESKWLVSDYEQPIDEDFQALVNKDIDTGKSRIPEKYKDFERTKVSFACKRAGNKLLPVENSTLYCYLPTSASWGFPFLMNTDMIPKGDRDDIEREVYLKDEDETNFNLELARIAGEKFFNWIEDLVKGGKYDYDSIFALIPDFDKCIKAHGDKYDDFIQKFKDGFESKMEGTGIIPVVENKTIVLKQVCDVIYDTTGFSCTGFLKDEEILSLCGWSDWFPHPLLRDYDKYSLLPGIKGFLAKYHDENQEFDVDALHAACDNEEFQEWLSNDVNNEKFISFLLKKGIIDSFSDSPIFLAEGGGLYSPGDLYYELDEYYDDLKPLDEYLVRLSIKTRTAFSKDKKWEAFRTCFTEFDPDSFVDDVLLDSDNFDNVHTLLKEESASISFMRFLAAHVGYSSSYRDFPFLDQNGEMVDNFTDTPFVFLPSEAAVEIRSKEWIDPDWIGVISSKYDEDTIDYIRSNFELKEFEDKIIVQEIACSTDYQEDINERIGTFAANKSFVDYLFLHQEHIKDGNLSPYYVSVIDKEGEELFLKEDEEFIYIRNKGYNEYEVLPWIDAEMMYSLNESYYSDRADTTAMKSFFTEKYEIPAMTGKLFLDDIVLRQSDTICENLDVVDTNVVFWRWVKSFAKEVATIPSFAQFPLLVKELDEEEYECKTVKDAGIYLSNDYQPSSGIESIVKKYASDALFVASDYLEDSSSGTISGWVEFFKNLGLKTTIVDLVFGKIIPNIGELEEDGLPDLLGQYYSDIQDRWDEVKKKLKTIKVKTQDGAFTLIKDCVLVDVNKEKEPFPDITFDNQIDSAVIATRSARKLLLDIAGEAGSLIIDDITQWQETKFNAYAGCEDDYSIEEHLRIIEELTSIDVETIKSFKDLNYLRLLNRDDEYSLPKELTLGTRYNPGCHFEKHGVLEGIEFVSDRYSAINSDDSFSNLAKKVLKCHHLFEESDVKYLTNFRFCVYFWAEYAPRHFDFVEGLIEDGVFDDAECVPTMAGNVYVPADVYARSIKEYVVNKIPEWEDKLPTTDIPENEDEDKDLLKKLKCRESLTFKDGLSALLVIKSKEKREKILRWMQEDYESSYSDEMTEYRANEAAIWKNGKGEDKHITELYALAPESKTLRDFFRDNEYVLNSDYISAWRSNDDYRAICNMMQIPIIEESDMEFEPDGQPVSTLARYFTERLLVVAAIEDPEKWKEAFEGYKEDINGFEFWCCSSISWKYSENENIYQNSKKFYAKDGKYYFVKDWCNRHVFADFMRTLYEDLGCDLNEDQFLSIMDPDISVDESLDPYHSLRTDEFIAELAKYNADYVEYVGPKVQEEEEDDDDEQASALYAPTHTYSYIEQVDEDEEPRDNTSVIESKEGETPLDNDGSHGEEQVKVSDTSITPEASITSHTSKAESTPYSNPMPEDKAKPDSGNKDVTEEEKNHSAALESEVEDFDVVEPQDQETVEEEYEYSFDPDGDEPIGSVEKDKSYQPLGSKPSRPRNVRRAAKQYTKTELNRLRSNGTPLELESLPPTKEELDILAQCGISPEQIADTNYLAQLRLYRNLQQEMDEEPEESLSDFIRNADDVSEHKLKSGKFIHACSAARGVMYVSPSVWNKMLDEKWVICIYLDGKGKNFHYINSAEEFLKLVQKDDVVIKITGKEKVDVVNKLYTGLLENAKGTAYTLIRVAARTNMDAVFAHYVGAMAEKNDGNEPEDMGEYI